MTRSDAPEDLLVRARQGLLTKGDEERRFRIALQSSTELELLYDAGVQFDAEASLLPGDEAQMAALVRGVLARATLGDSARASHALPALVESGARQRFWVARSIAIAMAVGALFAVTIASAWQYAEKQHWLGVTARRPPSVPNAATPAPPVAHARAIAPALVTPSSSSAASANGATATPLIARSVPAPTASFRRHRAALAPHGPSASLLFASASEARRVGDIETAIALYQRLCLEYPSSVEAEDAKVLAGKLLLSQQSPRAALREFAGYGSGTLTAEALWGQAQALRKLASPDERGVLERLARDYANSPYAPAAQKRLQELAR